MAVSTTTALLATGIAASTASAATGIAGAYQSQPSGRLSFSSPEMEFDFLNRIGDSLKGIDEDIQKSKELESALSEKLTIERNRVNGVLPSQNDLQRLSQANQKIAFAFGGNSEEAIRQKFLTQADVDLLNEAKEAENMQGTDPRIENQIADKEQALREGLQRQLGPGYETTEAGQRALASFQREAESLRFGTRQDLINQKLARIQTRSGISLASRAQGLNEAVAGQSSLLNTLQGEREAFLTGSNYLAQLAEREFSGGLQGIGTRGALNSSLLDIFKTLGSTDITKQGKQALESGLVGPGSLYEQSGGIARSDFGRFRDTQKAYEKPLSKANLLALNPSLSKFLRGPSSGYRPFPYGSPSQAIRSGGFA